MGVKDRHAEIDRLCLMCCHVEVVTLTEKQCDAYSQNAHRTQLLRYMLHAKGYK